MKLNIKKAATSKLVHVFLQDSSSTTGAGLTGLTNASSGLVCYRARLDDGNAGGTQLSLSAGTRGTWSSGGFKEKDATNMPGIYELGLDNAGLATASNSVVYMLTGATNLAPCAIEIALVDYDPQDAVRLGLTALPNVASGTTGAIPTTGTGTAQINVDGSGNVAIGSNVKKNTAKAGFMFVMTDSTTHAPKTGVTVTATRSLDGAVFGSCTNAVSEVSNGTYVISLSAADTNADHVMLRFTGTSADDLNIEIVTQP